jgi:hypothetical protein
MDGVAKSASPSTKTTEKAEAGNPKRMGGRFLSANDYHKHNVTRRNRKKWLIFRRIFAPIPGNSPAAAASNLLVLP